MSKRVITYSLTAHTTGKNEKEDSLYALSTKFMGEKQFDVYFFLIKVGV